MTRDAFVSLDLGYIYYSCNSNTFINSAVSFFCVDFVSTSTDLSRNNKCYDNQISKPCYYGNIKSI